MDEGWILNNGTLATIMVEKDEVERRESLLKCIFNEVKEEKVREILEKDDFADCILSHKDLNYHAPMEFCIKNCSSEMVQKLQSYGLAFLPGYAALNGHEEAVSEWLSKVEAEEVITYDKTQYIPLDTAMAVNCDELFKKMVEKAKHLLNEGMVEDLIFRNPTSFHCIEILRENGLVTKDKLIKGFGRVLDSIGRDRKNVEWEKSVLAWYDEALGKEMLSESLTRRIPRKRPEPHNKALWGMIEKHMDGLSDVESTHVVKTCLHKALAGGYLFWVGKLLKISKDAGLKEWAVLASCGDHVNRSKIADKLAKIAPPPSHEQMVERGMRWPDEGKRAIYQSIWESNTFKQGTTRGKAVPRRRRI